MAFRRKPQSSDPDPSPGELREVDLGALPDGQAIPLLALLASRGHRVQPSPSSEPGHERILVHPDDVDGVELDLLELIDSDLL